ncbi:MAG: formate dehydrogenase accessory sulfurtransferase FdhD [Ferruginibacter sp.]
MNIPGSDMDNDKAQYISVKKIIGGEMTNIDDQVAVEEPLQIQLAYSTANGRMQKNIAVTMRTPGNDEELAAGFLFTEGIIKNRADVYEVQCFSSDKNRVLVTLFENVNPLLNSAARNFYSTSSCGVCGKASIDAINVSPVFLNNEDSIRIPAYLLHALPGLVRKQQRVFDNTGGIHASGLFTLKGELVLIREDIGRHNALDKIIGAAFLKGQLPLNQTILLLSGRAGFELVQKALMAGIKIIIAVGAPSSLAVELAKEWDITLVGFLREGKFNIYAGWKRIEL